MSWHVRTDAIGNLSLRNTKRDVQMTWDCELRHQFQDVLNRNSVSNAFAKAFI